jgi:hypothetical protein
MWIWLDFKRMSETCPCNYNERVVSKEAQMTTLGDKRTRNVIEGGPSAFRSRPNTRSVPSCKQAEVYRNGSLVWVFTETRCYSASPGCEVRIIWDIQHIFQRRVSRWEERCGSTMIPPSINTSCESRIKDDDDALTTHHNQHVHIRVTGTADEDCRNNI